MRFLEAVALGFSRPWCSYVVDFDQLEIFQYHNTLINMVIMLSQIIHAYYHLGDPPPIMPRYSRVSSGISNERGINTAFYV